MGIITIIKTIYKVIAHDTLRFYQYFFKTWGVHTEAVFYDPVWEKVIAASKKRKSVWFCITPVNYEYAQAFFNLKMSKAEYSKILAKRYQEMADLGQRIELHVHLTTFNNMTEKEQRKIVADSITWMKDNGFNVKEFIPGWWAYNRTLIKIVRELGLNPMRKNDYYALHDYDMITDNNHLS